MAGYGCSTGQTGNARTDLNAAEFSKMLDSLPDEILLDVRTPEEFSDGHIENAVNINWNSLDFKTETSKLDKAKPVMVYCLSGGRSSAAASYLRSSGFTQVYELSGGMLKWRASGLPETTAATKKDQGMSKEQFEAMLVSDKLVLVDFFAEWCMPCKKMKPYLEEIEKEHPDKVKVLRIDIDQNPSLAELLQIDAIPVLMLFKEQASIWTNVGFIEKTDVLKKILE
ncbi:MAG: thioredoxin [Flavobacteriales bacterium]|nr:thioredoxin [Flavobacteriales bacterium]